MSLLTFIPIGTQLLKTSRQKVAAQSHQTVQAVNVARAGLQESVAWFRRQNNGQPVCQTCAGATWAYPDQAFFPTVSSSDTIDQSIGLVKEDRLGEANDVYFRYEVPRQPAGVFISSAVHDITGERVEGFSNGDGLAWYIESVGYVFKRNDPSRPFDQAPNKILGRARVSTEIRRVNVTPPANAAVIIDDLGDGAANPGTRISGGVSGFGVTHRVGSGGTWDSVAGGIDDADDAMGMDFQDVFGIPRFELRDIADFNVDNVGQLPASYPPASLVYINGNAVFGTAKPLQGSGVLVVDGNLTIPPGTNALFSGFIYVTGNVTIDGPATISGSLMVLGNLTLNPDADTVEIEYDPDALQLAAQDAARYRENRSTYHVSGAR